MTVGLLLEIKVFLVNSGFEVSEASAPFAFVAQNEAVLLFVFEVKANIDDEVKNAMALLAPAFRSKRFGPKTMEMYAIFAVDEGTPMSDVERWEQDLKFCRKVFVSSSEQLAPRLSFLQSINSSLTLSVDINSMFWTQLGSRLTVGEVEFMRQLAGTVRTTDELLALVPKGK